MALPPPPKRDEPDGAGAFAPPKRLPDPAVFELLPPKRPLDVCDAGGLDSAGFRFPNKLPEVGGGAAGVVEFAKLKVFAGAGVVEPAGAELAFPNKLEPAGLALLPPPPKRLLVVPAVFCAGALVALVGVVPPLASSFFCPKLKPPLALAPPNRLPLSGLLAAVPAPLPKSEVVPELPPNTEGVAAPVFGVEPERPPNNDF